MKIGIKNSKIEKDSIGYCALHSCSLNKEEALNRNCFKKQCLRFIRLENDFWNTEEGVALTKRVNCLHDRNNVGRNRNKRKRY